MPGTSTDDDQVNTAEFVEDLVDDRRSIRLRHIEATHDGSGARVWRSASSRSSLRANSPKRQPSRFNSWASASPIPDEAPMMTAVRPNPCSYVTVIVHEKPGTAVGKLTASHDRPSSSAEPA